MQVEQVHSNLTNLNVGQFFIIWPVYIVRVSYGLSLGHVSGQAQILPSPLTNESQEKAKWATS